MEITEETIFTIMKQIVETQDKIVEKLYKSDNCEFISIEEARRRLGGINEKAFREMMDDGTIESAYVGEGIKKRVIVADSIVNYVKKVRKNMDGKYHSSYTNMKNRSRATGDDYDRVMQRGKFKRKA